MQIVIDIPKVQYENLAKIANAGKEPLGYWERVVMSGVPLPKGHGDLIDRKELMDSRTEKAVLSSGITRSSTQEQSFRQIRRTANERLHF